jgi:hypothetical protein
MRRGYALGQLSRHGPEEKVEQMEKIEPFRYAH